MKTNMTFPDRIIRLILAVTFIALFLNNIVTGPAGVILIVLAVVFTVTASFNFCPLYTALGINKKVKKSNRPN